MQSDPPAPKVARVYLRVSTDEQDLQRQEAITEQAKAAGKYRGRQADEKRRAQVLALRGSGHSINRTAELTGFSVSQVKRICASAKEA